jgi:ribosomal protein S18 acetylase RimI-like enzyme
MVFRPVVFQDKDKILRLLEQRGAFNKQEIHIAMELVDEALQFPEKRDYYVICAVDPPDSLAGYICFGPIPLADDCYDLYWIAVYERLSRKGVGGKLLECMEDFVTGKKARRIYVDTSSTTAYDAARSFYEKHGYRLACVLEDFYRENDHKMIYMKELRRCSYQKQKQGLP